MPAHAQYAGTSLPPDGFVDRWTADEIRLRIAAIRRTAKAQRQAKGFQHHG